MGVFNVSIEFGDPQRQNFERIDALVDTGASHTSLPASVLSRLGVTPHDRGRFQLANGQIITRDIGQTWVRLDGRTQMTPIVFNDEGTVAILGAITLEEFRLGVDPLGKKLIEIAAYLMQHRDDAVREPKQRHSRQ